MQTFNPPPPDLRAHDRFMKLIFFSMVFSVGLYAVCLTVIAPIATRISDGMKIGVGFCAVGSALVVLFLRFLKIAALLTPDFPTPIAERLAKLRVYFIVCYVFSETVALYGFVLRFMGASIIEVVPFFAGALILDALCYPRLPSDVEGK